MLSTYERHDYPVELQQFALAVEACEQAMKLVARVDVARALAFITTMHLQGQASQIPDDRSDFGHKMALLEAAKTMWLLARYAAREAQEVPDV